MFYGFARYYLRHGVPWTPCAGAYRRVTVTLRSVPPPPTAPRRRKMEKETEHDAKQRRLMDVRLGCRESEWMIFGRVHEAPPVFVVCRQVKYKM